MASTTAQYGFGSGILYGLRTDVVASTPTRFGVLQDVSIDFSAETKELYGQLQFPVDVARGKTKIMGKAKFALLQTSVYNNLFFGQTTAAGQQLFSYNETDTVGTASTAATTAGSSTTTLTFSAVPAGVVVGTVVKDITTPSAIAAGTYVVAKSATTVTLSVAATGVLSADSIQFGPSLTATNSATFAQDLGVYYAATGLPLTYVVGGPVQGQYTVNSTGVYSFSAADAGASVLVNYQYGSSTTGFTLTGGNPLMGTTPKFSAFFEQSYEGHTLALELYACVSSKLTLPTKIDDYIINELDFSAFANASGQVFSLSLDN